MIVGIDGVACAGKSTLVKKLRNKSSYQMIPEHSRVVGGPKNLPDFPESKSQALGNVRKIIEIERKRKEIFEAKKDSSNNILLDISPVGNLVFNFAMRELSGYNALPYSLNRHIKELKEGRIIEPDLFLILELGVDKIKERIKERLPDPLWNNDFFLKNEMKGFKLFEESCKNAYLINADKSKEELAAYVDGFLNRKDIKEERCPLKSFKSHLKDRNLFYSLQRDEPRRDIYKDIVDFSYPSKEELRRRGVWDF